MKEKIIVFSFLGYILFFSVLHIILKDNEISTSERRKLNQFPEFEFNSKYIEKLDKYLLDQFPYRDDFRSIKANFNYKILNKLENNSIYLKDNYIFKSEFPTNEKSINNFITNISKIKENFKSTNNVYLMIIPDKNYYLNSNDFLHLDYDLIFQKTNSLDIKTIDIKDTLTLADFYKTDTHWKQENLDKVVIKICEAMNLEYEETKYQKNVYNNFYGVYYSESALKRDPETITYLTNDTLNNVDIYYLENEDLKAIYNKDNLGSNDSYEVYLDGASAYIEITNENATTDRELIIFRDSFGSSLTPLLVNYYKKITVVDNRYMNMENILKYVEFNNQDILIMYSTLLVNNSFSLKG